MLAASQRERRPRRVGRQGASTIKKRIRIALGVLALLLAGGALALVLLVDPDSYRGMIEERAGEALGREVRLGALRVSFWPVLGVRVDDVIVAGRSGEAREELLTARSVRLGARFIPLLRGRLEVTSIVVEEPSMELVRDASGAWNLQGPEAAPDETPPDAATAPPFSVERLNLTGGRLSLVDRSVPGAPFELTLAEIDLTLLDFAFDRPFDLRLAAVVEELAGARLEIEGRGGPLVRADGVPLGATAKLALDGFDPARLAVLMGAFTGPSDDAAAGVAPSLARGRARIAGDIDFRAPSPDTSELRGNLSLEGVEVRFVAPDGTEQSAAASFQARYDIGIARGGAAIDVRDLELEIGDHRLNLRGTLREEGGAREIDAELLPARIPADDLAALAALLLGELPASFASPTPIEIEGRVRGPLGGDRWPDIEGQARLRDFTFISGSMRHPIEQVQADVALRGESVAIRDLSGVIGSSDIGGTVEIEGFANPAMRFDLRSRRADLDELFASIVETPEAGAEGSSTSATMDIDGHLRIDDGVFLGLAFSALDTTVRMRGDTVTLDPLRMDLYGGNFTGQVSGDLADEVPKWRVRGEAAAVDVDAFLTATAGLPGQIAGRFTGRFDIAAAGSETEQIVASTTGSASAEVGDGRIGHLSLLQTVAKASEAFGERTLRKLSAELATEGTAFGRLSGRATLDNGRMRLDDLSLAAPSFDLTGSGALNLVTAEIEGRFRLALSREISQSMRDEGSKAAEVLWVGSSQRVELPVTLSGPFDAPSATVDIKGVARDAVRDRLESWVQDRLGQGEKQPEAEPAPESLVGTPSTGNTSAPAAPGDPGAAITRTRWSGSLLARDLKIEGTASGAKLDRATLTVTDARGEQVLEVERLPELDAALAAAADRDAPVRVPFTAGVDGKRILLARFPLKIKLVVHTTDGRRAEAVRDVE